MYMAGSRVGILSKILRIKPDEPRQSRVMKNNLLSLIVLVAMGVAGCELPVDTTKEKVDGYLLNKGTPFSVILKTPLSSNTNQRGDPFVTVLKSPYNSKGSQILPGNTEIRGLIKRAVKYEKFGDRASLVLLFDQIILGNGAKIPIVAGLNTSLGMEALKIPGAQMKAMEIVAIGALVGALAGEGTLGKEGLQEGLIIGAGAGMGAVLYSNMKEINLPEGTEIKIKLEEPVVIPKR